ncbi:LacI family DNA-binding transcriptional regulator [Lacrimispora sp. 210928-DFI.3.58]|uniref:LacI family DNA-binding transcriptional regulator n=1 Tax=Lacrimispora sp. 210928-DFI.3.58 TaxID=2883214 RepID=UPI0015B665EE|nr:LacI family DNA-binding transcriptional regulator [Lacrimispora sp. 210928-DFI.3.58]MCB7319268.1 LacI family transcriptional regulator [Lacrimispora sp. 210928-DFI.3.58]
MSKRKEVALAAGVSEATVSHVINGTKYVSPELTMRVRKAIEEKGYRLNQAARCLATNRSGHLALIVNNLKNPRYAEVAEAMQEEARAKGYIVSTIDINLFNFTEDAVFDLISRNVDGLFLATYIDSMEPAIKRACEGGIKVISGNPEFGHILDVSYRKAIVDMVKCLAELGHERIAFLSGYSTKESKHTKYGDFCEALRVQGLPLIRELIVEGEPPYIADLDAGYHSMKELLGRTRDFTAVFAVNDLVAIGAMKALREQGLRIPEDISVVGCDDIQFASYMEPALATIRIPKGEMGMLATDMLYDILNGNTCEDTVLTAAFQTGASIAKHPA